MLRRPGFCFVYVADLHLNVLRPFWRGGVAALFDYCGDKRESSHCHQYDACECKYCASDAAYFGEGRVTCDFVKMLCIYLMIICTLLSSWYVVNYAFCEVFDLDGGVMLPFCNSKILSCPVLFVNFCSLLFVFDFFRFSRLFYYHFDCV